MRSKSGSGNRSSSLCFINQVSAKITAKFKK
jgi:hypothetical protein